MTTHSSIRVAWQQTPKAFKERRVISHTLRADRNETPQSLQPTSTHGTAPSNKVGEEGGTASTKAATQDSTVRN